MIVLFAKCPKKGVQYYGKNDLNKQKLKIYSFPSQSLGLRSLVCATLYANRKFF